jgi:hypothetical protein
MCEEKEKYLTNMSSSTHYRSGFDSRDISLLMVFHPGIVHPCRRRYMSNAKIPACIGKENERSSMAIALIPV